MQGKGFTVTRRVVAVALFGLLAIGGCSQSHSEVTFTRQGTSGVGRVYEDFPGAYITSNRDGEYDVVLVNDTLRAAVSPRSRKHAPLHPVAQPPLQQAIHIHVFWRPVSGAMIKESSVTNAIVHWYVFSGEASGRTDMVHYQGAAFVQMESKGDTAYLTIGDGEITPRQVRGDLKDPIGPSKITGSVSAVRNDARVRDLLARLEAKASGEERLWTEAENDNAPAFAR
jgi:hypothetical protein